MRFRFAQQSHVGDYLVEPGAEMEVPPIGRDKSGKPIWHVPGPHWEPLDDDAKALCKSLRHEYTGEMPDVLTGLAAQLESAGAAAKIDSVALGRAVAEGVSAALGPILEAQSRMLPILAAIGRELERREAPPKDAAAPKEKAKE